MYESNFLEEEDKGMIYFKTVTEAYIDYLEFCRDAGHKHPLGRNNFSVRMEAIGFSKLKKTNGWHLEKNYLKKEL